MVITGHGKGNGNGFGDGYGYGDGFGDGDGDGYGHGYGYGHGNGSVVELMENGIIRVGCRCKTIEDWENTWEEEAKEHGVSHEKASEMIDLARAYVEADKEQKKTATRVDT